MKQNDSRNSDGISRRGFLKAAGMGSAIATAGLPVTAALAAGDSGQDKSGAQPLPKRRLGKTGVDVSILSLGGMFDTINNQLLLKQAYNWGVTYWDTAEAYGNGQSEEGFGRWFSRNPEKRKEIFLATKSRPVSPSELTGKVDNALQRLKTDYIDLFFIHALSSASEMTGQIKDWSAGIKKSGKVKFIGFSTHTNMEDCLLDAAKMDWIDVIMFSYNFRLMHTDKMKQALDACVKADIGLVAMKTQGGGPVKADSPAELEIAGRFLERGFTDKQAKLKAVWEDPRIAGICSQMPNLTILSANVAAGRDQTKLSTADFDLFAQYAHETRHGYCAGCGNVCSAAVAGLVPVSDVMRYLMYYRDYGERDLARDFYAELPDDVRAKIAELDYARAERACPQGLAIADLMRTAATLLA